MLLCVRDLLARFAVHRPAVGIVGIIATVTDLFHDPAVVRVDLGPVLITDSEAL